MKKTAKTAEKTAQAQAQATQAQGAQVAPTKAETKKAQNALYKEVEARANMVAEAISGDRASLSAMLRDLYAYATGAHPIAENIRHALRADIKAITGAEVDTYATAREFSRVWMDIVKKYATAQDAKTGEAVSIHPYAGMIEAVEFRPNIRTLYTEVVHNWVRGLAPIKMRTNVWYKRDKKDSRVLTIVPQAEAQTIIQEYEKRTAIAREGAKQGRAEALRKYDGATAQAQA